jgi:murein DD-endopeptidase MepM/ murein hydrolase activator NlpD
VASRRYSITVADNSAGVERIFTVRLGPVATFAFGVLVLPLVMGLGARWSAGAAIDELRTTNAALEMENASYREATAQLSSQISALQAAVDEIGGSAAVDPAAMRAMEKLPAIVKSRAMGGGTTGTPLAPGLGGTVGPADAAFGVLRDLLTILESRLDTVRDGVERRQALAAATPSIWPVAGWLSSAYGNRRDPFTGGGSFHPGLDISAAHGQPILATGDGVVVSATANGNYGNLVVIDHGYGISTRYGHLSRFAVMTGQQIRRGDVVGYVGSTGRSTSPHLHYEVWVNGRLTNPLRLLGPR